MHRFLATIAACLLATTMAGPASAIDIFLSNTSTTGSAVPQNETEAIDVSGGGTGTLGIWVTDLTAPLVGIDLNLILLNDNAIDITGGTINNPTIGSAKRWFDNGSVVGTNVDVVSIDEIHLTASTTGTGTPGEGMGLGDPNDPDDNGAGTAFLFATVDYNITLTTGAADLYLQIGDLGIADPNGFVSVVFGLNDPPLDPSDLAQRNINSATRDGHASAGGSNPTDPDGNGLVNGADLLVIQRNDPSLIPAWRADYGGAPSAAAASLGALSVPEPSAFLLTCCGVALLCLRRNVAFTLRVK